MVQARFIFKEGECIPNPCEPAVLIHPQAIGLVIRIARKKALITIAAPCINKVHAKNEQAHAKAQHAARSKRDRVKPPANVLDDISRVLAKAVTAIGDDAAMCEVGKAQAKAGVTP